MTVKELKELLEKFDESMEVKFETSNGLYPIDTIEVTEEYNERVVVVS